MDFCLLLRILVKREAINIVRNFLIVPKKYTKDEIKIASKKAIRKWAEANGDLIDKKIADKITSVSKKSSQNDLKEAKDEIEIPKERYISPEKRQIIDELRTV